jgi:hypothetical protein
LYSICLETLSPAIKIFDLLALLLADQSVRAYEDTFSAADVFSKVI